LPTWTIAALSPEIRRVSGRCWRVVEAQHVVSTMALVDTLDEQALLEQVLDDSKPAVPDDCREHHYLLFTPFRYGALHPQGSRFRSASQRPGVFYASLHITTAVAEMAFWRLLFYAESPATPWPANAGEFTAFAVRFSARKGLDLTRPPLNRDAVKWTDPMDYTHCQALADTSRSAGVQAVKYQSARAPGLNVALFTCEAFATRTPEDHRRWRIHVSAAGARAIGEFPDQRLAFDRAAFARDPRIASLKWDR
jgi:RES domain